MDSMVYVVLPQPNHLVLNIFPNFLSVLVRVFALELVLNHRLKVL